MLKFTFLLHYRIRHGVPYTQLIVTHVVETFIFVPLMVGILFFLNEFYGGDRLLSFMSMTVVWLAEIYSVICARTIPTAKYFPRVFLLYFILYHAYVFIFPAGFCYLALFTMTLFLQHAMYFFWYRYELPALYLGKITPRVPRMIAGEIIGQSVLEMETVTATVGDNEFSTSSVVLEDEIELSRRVQQQQMVELFLSSEVRNRERHAAMVASATQQTQQQVTAVRRHSAGGSSSPTNMSPLHPLSAFNSPARRIPIVGSPTVVPTNSATRNTRVNARIRDLDQALADREARRGIRSESIQSLFDFASAN